MKITKLSLSNYRGVQALSLDFHEKLNVFFGINGAGKSTVLDAVAIMLSWVVNRLKWSGSTARHISEIDIKNGKNFSSIEICCSYEGQNIEWKLSKSRKGRGQPEDPTNLKNLNYFTKKMQAQIAAKGEDNIALPLFVYYPVNRSVLDIPLRIKGKHTFDIFAAYDSALTGGASFRTFFEWFREREDLENENRKHAESLFENRRPALPDPQLEAVRSALKSVLPEFGNLTVRRHPLRMEVQKGSETLRVDQLSDGEKCLIAMIGDLARRMAIANPIRRNPLEGEGIVLIDEIDLHLHPTWQRMIIPKILEVFPNCQFVISTHSPHVLTHMKSGSLYLLEHMDAGIRAEKITGSYGKTVDRVLEDFMGLETTRPDEVSAALRDIYKEIDRSNLEGAKQKIKDLQKRIGHDPELTKAEVVIRRKELIGK